MVKTARTAATARRTLLNRRFLASVPSYAALPDVVMRPSPPERPAPQRDAIERHRRQDDRNVVEGRVEQPARPRRRPGDGRAHRVRKEPPSHPERDREV